jgi:hypothetical protein
VVSRWEAVPRGIDLLRGPNHVTRFTKLELAERYALPATWTITGPPAALNVFEVGMGCILDRTRTDAGVTTPQQVVSGQVHSIARTRRLDQATGRLVRELTVGFVEDTAEFWSRRCYPDPAQVLTSTPSTFSVSHDTRTGAREDLILAYTGVHLGPGAPQVARRLPGLVLPASSGRGGSTTVAARMNNLGDLVAELAEDAGLHVRIQHDEPDPASPRLLVTIDNVPDVSADIVFGEIRTGRATAYVTELDYSITAPDLTQAIVFSAGEQEARDAAIFADTAAETLWGRRREVLVDQRQTDDTAQITDAGTRALADGASPVNITFAVADSRAVKYGRDYSVGWRVGVELPGIPEPLSDNVVREVVTTVEPGRPDVRRIAVGTPGASVRDTKQSRLLAAALKRIAQVERGL